MRRPLDYMFLFAKSICIGAVEVLHGVSGGTMALLLSVTHELVFSLGEIDRDAFGLLKRGRFKSLWKKINGNFLLTFFAGLVTGWFSLLWVVSYLHQYFFIPTNAFFLSLISVSTLLILRRIKKLSVVIVSAFVAGILVALSLTLLPPFTSADNPLTSILAGFFSVGSLLLPGVSGTFVLLVLGKYQYIVTGFITLKIGIIAFFLIGCIFGLLIMARIIRWMLGHYQSVTVALLSGLTIGALNKLWPWRNIKEYASTGFGDRVPAYDESVLPWEYVTLTGKDPQIFLAILMMALGVFMVVLVEKMAAGLQTKI